MKRKLWIILAMAVLVAGMYCAAATSETGTPAVYTLKGLSGEIQAYVTDKTLICFSHYPELIWADDNAGNVLPLCACPFYYDPDYKNQMAWEPENVGDVCYFHICGSGVNRNNMLFDLSQINLDDIHLTYPGFSLEVLSVTGDSYVDSASSLLCYFTINCKATKVAYTLTDFFCSAEWINPDVGGLTLPKYETTWKDNYIPSDNYGTIHSDNFHIEDSPIYTDDTCTNRMETGNPDFERNYYCRIDIINKFTQDKEARRINFWQLQKSDCVLQIYGLETECYRVEPKTIDERDSVSIYFRIKRVHPVLLGTSFSATGFSQKYISYDIHADGYYLTDLTEEATWKNNIKPFYYLISSGLQTEGGDLVTSEPVAGKNYYMYIQGPSRSPNEIDYSQVSTSNCVLSVPGYTAECTKFTILHTQDNYEKPEYCFCIRKDCNVNFLSGSGTGTMSSQSVSDGTQLTLPECTFTPPEGYEFYRWKKGSMSYYNPGESVAITSDTNFYAQWKKKTCAISYNANGGTGSMTGTTITYGGQLRLPECTFTPPTGKVFDGWDLGQPMDQITINQDTIVKAQWADQYFNVTFHTSIGSDQTYSVKYGNTVTAPTPVSPSSNWTFQGWYKDEEYVYPYNPSEPITSETHFFAKWDHDVWYAVEYNYKGHPADIYPRVRVREGCKLVEPETPVTTDTTGSGCLVFGGWYTDYNCTSAYDFSQPVTGNYTLYAKWNVDPYIYFVNFTADGCEYYVRDGVYYPYVFNTLINWQSGTPDANTWLWEFSCYYTDADCTVPLTHEPEYGQDYYTILTLSSIDEDNTKISWGSEVSHYGTDLNLLMEDCTVVSTNNRMLTSSDNSHYYGIQETFKVTLPACYAVTFDLNGLGGVYYEEEVTDGRTAVPPADPYNTDWFFEGWFADEACEQEFDFSSPITGDTIIYAGWDSAILIEDCGEDVHWRLNMNTGSLVIFGTGAMTDYTGTNESPFKDVTGIKSIIIEEGVTSVGRSAFEGCSGVTSVTLPDTLENIGAWSFSQCAMSEIVFPEGLTGIGGSAFNHCPNLESVVIPEGVKTVDCFAQCGNLKSVTLPASCTRIGANAFYGCVNLENIIIPSGVTAVGGNAFYNCKGLTDITIPYAVTSIGKWTFRFCSNLTEVTILNPEMSIGTEAFLNCNSGLTMRSWSGSTAETYALENTIPFVSLGTLSGACGENSAWSFNPSTGVLTVSGSGQTTDYTDGNRPWESVLDLIRSVEIETGITGIGSYAFKDAAGLTEVSLPAGLTRIGDAVFCECKNLMWVAIPAGVSSIGSRAFEDCSRLMSIRLPSGISAIHDSTFRGCAALSSVTIPSNVKTIGTDAFASCWNLREVSISRGMVSIGDYAFENCTHLTRLSLPKTLASIGYAAFFEDTALTEVSVINPAAVIDDTAFYGCVSLILHGWPGSTAKALADALNIPFVPLEAPEPSFTLPAFLTSIEEEAFSGISAEAVLIPQAVTSISGNPFAESAVEFIYGYEGSAAQALADAYPDQFIFIPIDDT